MSKLAVSNLAVSNLAVSNIAWQAEDDARAYEVLKEFKIAGLEVAPTRVWNSWDNISPNDVEDFRAELEARDLRCVSLQAILYNQPNLQIFDTNHDDLYKHIQQVARIGGILNTQTNPLPLVFGSPKNRKKGDRSLEQAMNEAAPVFQKMAAICLEQNTVLGLEANPTDYNCDFITQVDQAAAFVQKVNHPGLRLHLDTAGMHLAGDDAAKAIADYADLLVHVHVSEPFLAGLDTPQVNHESIARALKSINWPGWTSLEMRTPAEPVDSIANLRESLETLTQNYR